PYALPYRIGEFVMMTKEMQPRVHARKDFVDHSFSRIDTASGGIKRPRRFVSQEDVDVFQTLAQENFLAHEMAPLVVAALPKLQRLRAGLASARRRQRR